MKTKIVVLTTLLMLVQVSCWAFDFTQLNRLIALLNILDKEKKQLILQRGIKKSGEAIKANSHATLEIHRGVEELLRNVDDFAGIAGINGKKFNDVVAWIQIGREITRDVSGFVNSQSMTQLDKMLQGNASGTKDAVATAQDIYKFFFDATSIESKIKGYAEYEIGKLSETEKILGFQTAMQKKKIATAMAYYRSADELYTQAITLSNAIVDPNAGTPLKVSNEGLFGFDGPFADMSDLADPFDVLTQASGGILGGILGGIVNFLTGGFKDDSGNEYSVGGGWPVYSNANNLDGSFDGFQGNENGLRMTLGERIGSQKSAIDMLTKSNELREKADKLMEEAMQKTPLQQAYEADHVNDMMRTAAVGMDIEM